MESSPGSAGEKLRLMCSYGGHIVPRPHDKSLCYAGGETRLVAVHRKTAVSLSSLTAHLTKTLQFPPPPSTFTVKYQLPNHDLDSLISISTDEDLSNMLDEYDRLSSSPSPSRLRFFLFPNAADSCVGLLHDPKTEGWFIDALRSAGVKSGSGLGDSGTSLPESIPVEERERDRDNSSFGSTSSSSYSPAVRGSGSGSGGGGGCGGGDDSGAHQFQDVKVVLPSVDSLGSDSSIPSPNFSQQAIVYQDASGFAEVKAVSANVVENESMSSDRSPRSDMLTPVQVSGYILSKPTDHPPQVPSPPLPPPPPPPQHYYHHPGPQTHYVNQYYPSSVPVASYPTMYQPYVQSQQHMQYQQINKPYPVYMMAVGQAQNPYDMSMQYSVATPQTVTPSQPQVASKPVVVASQMVYEGYKPVAAAPEYTATVCKPTAVVTQPVTVSTDDHHHQVVAFPPPAAPQPVAVAPFENTNYVSEYEDPMHAQIYKTQPSLPPQVQTTTNAATVILSESVTQ